MIGMVMRGVIVISVVVPAVGAMLVRGRGAGWTVRRCHQSVSQIADDLFELVQRLTLARFTGGVDRVFKAMIDMVLHQLPLGTGDGFFNGLQLLGDIQTGAFFFQHAHDGFQMAFSPAQAVENFGVVGMFHVRMVSPRGGYGNREFPENYQRRIALTQT